MYLFRKKKNRIPSHPVLCCFGINHRREPTSRIPQSVFKARINIRHSRHFRREKKRVSRQSIWLLPCEEQTNRDSNYAENATQISTYWLPSRKHDYRCAVRETAVARDSDNAPHKGEWKLRLSFDGRVACGERKKRNKEKGKKKKKRKRTSSSNAFHSMAGVQPGGEKETRPFESSNQSGNMEKKTKSPSGLDIYRASLGCSTINESFLTLI